MNAFQKCKNTSDAAPLYLPQQLFLKPTARLNISVQLPQFRKLVGKSVSNWEIMEQLRAIIQPDSFTSLNISKSTVEFVRFEAEVDDRKLMEKTVSRLDNKMIKLKDFKDHFRVRAAEAKSDFPTAHMWDSFFRDAKDMDEMKPGQRPDTIHLSNLPIKWFVPYHLTDDEDPKPSEKILYRIFEKFGNIRNVDIPVCDPYRSKMKAHLTGIKMHSLSDKTFFEGYVQFKDYIGFARAMDALRGMKLVRKQPDEVLGANIKVNFDTTKHLSDSSIKRREIVRDKLVEKEHAKEEKVRREKEAQKQKEEQERKQEVELKSQKEQRRKLREEKRKAKILERLKINGADEINAKIAKEEKKLLKAQRKLESIRLVEELFKRIKEKKTDELPSSSLDLNHRDKLTQFKNSSELEVRKLRANLHEALEGRIVLRNMLSESGRAGNYSSSSSDESVGGKKKKGEIEGRKPEVEAVPFDNVYDPNWYGYSVPGSYYPYAPPQMYPPMRGHPGYVPYIPRGRGAPRGMLPGPSRGGGFQRRPRPYFPRNRGGYRNINQYPPELQDEYIRYFSKFLNDHHDDRDRRTYSRSRSRSNSRRRSRRSYTRSRSRSRSYSRSRSRSHRRRSSSRRSRRSERHRSRSRSKSGKRSSKRSRTRSKSVDSSKFISPQRMRSNRSKSWSMPRSGEKARSWSKTPEKSTTPEKR